MFYTKFGLIWPSGSREEVINVKSLQADVQTDRRTEDGQHKLKKPHLNLWLRRANKNYVHNCMTLHVLMQSTAYIIYNMNRSSLLSFSLSLSLELFIFLSFHSKKVSLFPNLFFENNSLCY